MRHYYLDGYNVLHKSTVLRPLAALDFETGREALIDKVAQFCAGAGERVTIVFDGRGLHRPDTVPHERGVVGLDVVFAPRQITADTLIERIIYQRADRRNAIVVSNDSGLRALCQGMGALVMEADHFLRLTREVRAEMDAAVARTRRPKRAETLEDRLDPNVLARLEALRNELLD